MADSLRNPAKQARTWLLPVALAAGLLASTPVLAQHHRHHGHHQGHGGHGGPRVHFGVVIGAPLFPLWYAPPPRYYYRAPVVVQAAAPVYIEQEPATAAPADASAYWYFCRESNTYYPYVSTCAGQWQRVTPQPPPG